MECKILALLIRILNKETTGYGSAEMLVTSQTQHRVDPMELMQMSK